MGSGTPALAKTLPTVKTARGWHVYFCGLEGFYDLGNGEYRGDSGHYCLLPPSRHPSGITYEWILPLPDGELPSIDPRKAGLLPIGTESTEEIVLLGEAVSSQASLPSPCSPCSLPSLSPGLETLTEDDKQAIENAIEATLPHEESRRHSRIFELCRRLKALPSLATVNPAKLRPIVKEWHRRALPIIGTKPFSETWADFLGGQ